MSDLLTGHLEADRLTAFARGTLSEPECATIEEHVASCFTCQQALAILPEDPLAQLVRQAASAAVTGPTRVGLQPGYEILEEIGRGGMGVVYKARQVGLGRLVALKKLTGTDGTPQALARFRREAETIARLDHPHIVRIHEVGEHGGQLFLALEYVASGSLADHLTGPLPPRSAAELVQALALAMAHAHQRGIVHRDLKPANVLLQKVDDKPTCDFEQGPQVHLASSLRALCLGGEFFLAKITDFGLAKDLTRELAQTQTGAILGTPAYMAPEQASGQGRQLGPAADIYALGAILYECLTARPPFQGTTPLETLEQVRIEEALPPSRSQPKVPRDLETICLKCLSKEPPRRYGSARELAEDLGRFLAGEAIRARPVPHWERVWRWARRRPAAAGLVALAALSVVAALIGLGAHSTSLSAQVRRAEAGEANAQKQHERADTNYRQARQAIKQMLDHLEKFQAPGVPKIESLRRELQADALAFYEGIAQATADAEPSTRFDIAQADLMMARLLSAQGHQEAEQQHRLKRARGFLGELVAQEPANSDYQAELADCLAQLGGIACAQHRFEQGVGLLEEALAIRERVARAGPDNAALLRAVAGTQNSLGYWHYTSGRLQGAEDWWLQALRTRERLVRHAPDAADDQYGLAIQYTNLAIVYRDTGRLSEAASQFAASEIRLSELVRRHPQARSYASTLAQTWRNWGAMLNTAGQGEEARLRLTPAVEIMEKQLVEDPRSAHIKTILLGCLVAHMNNSTLLKRDLEGQKDWQRALALSAQLNSWEDLCTGALFDARFGAHALAAARAEHLARQRGISNEALYTLAQAWAIAAAAAQKDGQLPVAERRPTAERYAAEAVRVLNRVRSAGFFTDAKQLEKLQSDPDLAPLRQRDDFSRSQTLFYALPISAPFPADENLNL